MNKLIVTGFLILCTLNCFSTCIAIYIAGNGHIYVAADSRRTFLFGEDNGNKFESVCKIHNVGSNYFAISGFDDGALLQSATTALQQNANIDTALKCFGTAMTVRYKQLMVDAKLVYPEMFKHFLKNGLADVSFFGFHKGVANVVNVEFFVHQDKKGGVVTTYRIHRIFDLTVIGMSRDITNAKPEDLPSWEIMEQAPELYVEGLVKIEAKMQPSAVGEPIDLLELKPDGAVWIRKNVNPDTY
ncbi:MAG: hypothetical protein ACHQIM_12045 [Sphingobacteriales bacterium]